MYKVRTCRIAIRSVCPTSVTFRDHFPSLRPAANAVPDPRYTLGDDTLHTDTSLYVNICTRA